MRKRLSLALVLVAARLCVSAQAPEFRVPEHAVAGESLTIAATGGGEGVLYLVGPGQVIRRTVSLGRETQVVIKGEELRGAGRWIAIMRTGSRTQSQAFWVSPAKPANVSFLARPSRVPVARPGV